jgi:feruloyl esterase
MRNVWLSVAVGLIALLSLVNSRPADAADYANLPIVRPAESCESVAKTPLQGVSNLPTTIEAATLIDTPKGKFCRVTGIIAPAIHFEVDLPAEHWTQRYLAVGCGGLCGSMPSSPGYVTNCVPAVSGELALAFNDLGHESRMGDQDPAAFAADPQRRIDFAYRANHVTTVLAKKLIKAFYGQAQKYSYFVGCSDGGREALMEAQRYPDDFDGISAGDPAALLTIQNSFGGVWQRQANMRADGTPILLAAKGRLIHDTVLSQCDNLSGVKDGVLQDPRACGFEPASLQCQANVSDSSHCLTAEEVAALARIYGGASDGAGHHFTFGLQRGAELQLHFPENNQAVRPSIVAAFSSLRTIDLMFQPIGSSIDADQPFEFSPANYQRMSQFAPLYNATNTNLKPFAKRGGKLMLWHGWSDPLISPGISVAYYQGVQQFVGAAATDEFMRLFMLPGVAHCVNGDGYDKVDWLTPLMTWVELHRAPVKVLGGRTDEPQGQGPPSRPPVRLPYATPAADFVATRPIYAYPMVARYVGKGDPNNAASYRPVRSPASTPQKFDTNLELIGPDNQKEYAVQDGKLVVVDSH